jgi:hypothetical protein
VLVDEKEGNLRDEEFWRFRRSGMTTTYYREPVYSLIVDTTVISVLNYRFHSHSFKLWVAFIEGLWRFSREPESIPLERDLADLLAYSGLRA